MVCFFFFFYNPGACGISDVLARILEVDDSSFLICHRSSAVASSQIKLAENGIEPFRTAVLASGGVVFPWVDHPVDSWEANWLNRLSMLPISRILWIHEMWYQSVSGYRLSFREYVKRAFQKQHLKQVVKQFAPTALATTNGCYRQKLADAGYRCDLLPNTPTIPVGPRVAGEDFVSSKIEDRQNAWVVVSFGNLVLRYWDWHSVLRSFVVASQKLHQRAVWVILGRSLDKEVEVIKDFLLQESVPVELLHLGGLSSEEIDLWLQGADSGISGHSYALWEKSTGLQAMVARNMPVVTPRKGYVEDRYAKANPLLFASFNEIRLRERTQAPADLITSPSQWMSMCQSLLSSPRKVSTG